MSSLKQPHVLRAPADRWGGISWGFDCPYTRDETAPPPCAMGTEPDVCEWLRWEDWDARAEGEEWTGPEPEECDGWYSPDIGHVHWDPKAGCGAQFQMGELGWEDGVVWDEKHLPAELILPMRVTIHWGPDGEVVVAPWKEGEK